MANHQKVESVKSYKVLANIRLKNGTVYVKDSVIDASLFDKVPEKFKKSFREIVKLKEA